MPGGLKIKKTRKDYIAEKAFGIAHTWDRVPLGRYEELLGSPLVLLPLFQGSIPSCVTCSGTFVNMWFSWKENKEAVLLSWPFVFALIKRKFSGGVVPQDALDRLRKDGQTEDKEFPQARFTADQGSEHFLSEEYITEPLRYMAKKYRIKGEFFFQNPSHTEVYNALRSNPVIVGVSVDIVNWQQQTVIHPGMDSFKHAVVVVDVDKDGNWICVSWDKKEGLDIRILDKNYPFIMAIRMDDLPDGVEAETVRRGFSIKDALSSLCT